MNRIFMTALSVASLLGGAGVSHAQLTINQPRNGDKEGAVVDVGVVAGDSSVVSVNVPGGLQGSGEVKNGQNILIGIRVLNAAGVFQASPTGAALPFDTGVAYSNGQGANVDIDLSLFDFTGLLQIGYVVQLTATSATGSGIAAVFNASDESLDETLEIKTGATPVMSRFYVSATKAYMIYFDALDSDGDAVGAPNENVNDTDLGAGAGQFDASDLQVDTTLSFDGTEPAPTLLTNPVFAGVNNNIVIFDLGMGSTAIVGSYIRLSHDGAPGNPTHDLSDIYGNPGDFGSMSIEAVVALNAVSAELLRTVAAGATVVDVLRVTFNNSIADPGDAGDYTLLLSGMASAFTIANPGIDPADSESILFDVTAPGGDGIEADARTTSSLGATSGIFTLRVLNDGMGADLTDDLLQGIAVADDVTVDDSIELTLLAAGYGDSNTVDGRQDSALLVFNEPMALPAAFTGLSLTMRNSVAVNPIDQIAADGSLVGATTSIDAGVPANNIIPILNITLASIDIDANGTISARETNNALRLNYNPLTFDWDHDGMVGPALDANEPIPGTGDANVIEIDYTSSSAEITDASATLFATDVVAQLTANDYAPPLLVRAIILDGDNIDPDPAADITAANNNQNFDEQFPGGMPVGADIGQNLDARRLVLAFSEDTAALTNVILEEKISIGGVALLASANNFSTFGAHDGANRLTVRNSGSDLAFDVGATVILIAGSGIDDAAGFEATGSVTATDGRAPYVPLINEITTGGGPVHDSFTIDTNGDGFADMIRIGMTQPILASTLAPTDFTSVDVAITGVALAMGNASSIEITIAEGVVADNATISLVYKGTTDATLIASDAGAGGTGIALTPIDSLHIANPLPIVSGPSDGVAVMDIVGTGTANGLPLAMGTKIFAMVATPTVRSITAKHNTNFFTARDTTSITAWTNWLLGVGGADYIYLGRDAGNNQTYSNSKALADVNNASTLEDVMQLVVKDRLLTRITFKGRGENRATDRLSRGTIEICWDVLRSGDGTTTDFYAGGFVFGGDPILSKTIITSADGSFEMHVGAPISKFNSRANLNSIARPVILITELTDGTRFPLTSLVSSINGTPVLFNPNNRTRNIDLTAANATVFDFDLDNVGTISAYPGWNLLGFNRASGFATTTTTRPALPAGVVEADVVVGTKVPFANALDQFVYFDDTTPDGVWTSAEDANFQNIIIDHDCFSNFAFTMTSLGVQAGSKITNLVGGYGVGLFINETNTYGIFQFGAVRSGSDYFTASVPFPTTAATQGWGLFSAPSASSVNALKAANAELDFLIQFRNTGTSFDVMSIDLDAPAGSDNINDATDVNAGEASFYHVK